MEPVIAGRLQTHLNLVVKKWSMSLIGSILQNDLLINNNIDVVFKEKLEKVKWFLWRGNAECALEILTQLQSGLGDKKSLSELQELYEYLK
jgi:hypothetical protein